MTTLTRGGISVTLEDSTVAASGYYHDGQPWVMPAAGGFVRVTGWTPAQVGTGSSTLNGAMKNVRGNWTTQAFDGRSAFDGTKAFVASNTLVAGDVLLIARSGAGNGAQNTIARPTYFPLPGRSRIDETLSLTVVASPPAATAFRPSPIGNPSARIVKSQAAILWSLLPSMFSGSTHPNAPSFASLETIFGTLGADIMGNWTSDQWAPNWQHPGYGEYLASAVSEALVMACSIDALALKQALVVRLIQWGIDYWGAFADGRSNGANGGHMQGRKPLVIFAGHMLGDTAMADPDATLAADRFHENKAYYTDGTPMWDGPRWKWRYNDGLAASYAYQDDDPSTWAIGSGDVPGFFERYHGRSTQGANVGAAMALAAIGRTDEWGREAWAVIVAHMTTRNAAWAAAQRPEIPYYPNDVGKAWSYRAGGASRAFVDSQWIMLPALLAHRRQSYATAPASEQALPIAFELPGYASFQVEVYNAPPSGFSAVEVWIGHLLDEADESDGWAKWSDATSAISLVDLPNAYGWHAFDIDLAGDVASGTETRKDARWCLQVRYVGTPFVSAPLVFTVPT